MGGERFGKVEQGVGGAVVAELETWPRLILRHCERSEAIQSPSAETAWIASSQEFLAMTVRKQPRANQ